MKVAIIHDWLVTNAGAEKVLSALLELYPQADIFALVDFLDPADRQAVLGGRYAKSSFIQKLPFANPHFRNYLPLFPLAIESLDLRGYDLLISSSWAVAKGIKKDPTQLHISYCYTPIRYAWDLYEEYTANLSQPKKFFVQQSLRYIRHFDRKTLPRVNHFIADSDFVAQRIQKTYQREATTIYPPVDVDRFVLKESKEDFYLTASRLVPYKKTRLIVEAFNAMPQKRLVVIGDGEEFAALRAIAQPNITLLGYQEEASLIDHMQRSKAFVYAAVEDFGIVPIEAMACGTPVIALNQGGTAETVVDGLNGLHFQEQSADAIVDALHRFEQMEFDPKVVAASVAHYAKERFLEEMDHFISQKVAEWQR